MKERCAGREGSEEGAGRGSGRAVGVIRGLGTAPAVGSDAVTSQGGGGCDGDGPWRRRRTGQVADATERHTQM